MPTNKPMYFKESVREVIPQPNTPEYQALGKSLIEELRDKDPFIWECAIHKLGLLKYEPAVNPLIELLRAENGRYTSIKYKSDVAGARAAAAYSLGQIGGEKAIEELEKIVEGISQYNPTEERICVIESAIRGYANANGKSAIDKLAPLLDNKYWAIRANAVISLGDIGDEKAIAILTQRLNNEDENIVRGYIHESLKKLGDEIGGE